jgi:hypothetical protein
LEATEAIYTRLSETIKDMNLKYYSRGKLSQFELEK